jgi:alkylhydroperoxidase family enzyme
MLPADVARLREAGWNDTAILDLNLVVSYFAFVNRLADGLGVGLEPRWGQPPPARK